MTSRPASDEITLAHGDITVRLRPSLRAASTLERSHDGFANLFRRIEQFHTGTVREIILIAATDRKGAAAFLDTVSRLPICRFVEIAQASLARLCMGFIPAVDPDQKPRPNAKPTPWHEFYSGLFRTATGWLHWTPEQAWNATPTEISEAFAGHIAMLKAIHGSSDDAEKQDALPDLDATFDREGLNRLRGKGRLR